MKYLLGQYTPLAKNNSLLHNGRDIIKKLSLFYIRQLGNKNIKSVVKYLFKHSENFLYA